MSIIVWNGMDLVVFGVVGLCFVGLIGVIAIERVKDWWKVKSSTWSIVRNKKP